MRSSHRSGIHISNGLFAACDLRKGEEIADFADGAYMRLRLWEFYCASQNLPPKWAGFLGSKCLPTPAKHVTQVIIYVLDIPRHPSTVDLHQPRSRLRHQVESKLSAGGPITLTRL